MPEVMSAETALIKLSEVFFILSIVFLCSRREDAERVFGRWQEEVSLGPVISLQLSGVAALAMGHQVMTLTPPTSHHHQLLL